jgi:hypothetical protein
MSIFIQTSAFIIAAVLPFVLIVRWRHWGVIASVLFGWAVVSIAAVSFPPQARYDELGTGMWLYGGWFIMLVWCVPIYISVLIFRAIRKKK